jgi:copper chaperone CopZ
MSKSFLYQNHFYIKIIQRIGAIKMKKVIEINGMSCGHCQARVEQALNAITGVEAKVELKKNRAVVNLKSEVSDETLKGAVTEAGYEVVSISEKKGLFS